MTTTSTHASSCIEQSLYRDVISCFTSGVAVITTMHGGEKFGVTASAVSSLSMEPPMLLVCLNRRLPTAAAISTSGLFAVNILAEGQGTLAKQFATRHPDKFREVEVAEGELGLPLLTSALASLECHVVERRDVATHAVFMAEVHRAVAVPGDPLAYFRSQFGHFSTSTAS